MTAVNHEHEAEKSEYRRHVGDFDAYVQDGQENAALCDYQSYVLRTLAECVVPDSFEDWCSAHATRESAHHE